MCVVSMIMDHYGDRWGQPPYRFPQIGTGTVIVLPPTVEEITEFRRLLDRAREYDRKHNEPDCEMEEKRAKVKALADELGIQIDFINDEAAP